MWIIRILLFVAIVAVGAQISIAVPDYGLAIPITGQTMAILCLAMLIKKEEAIAGIVLYCLIGILGLPVFSNGGYGWAAFSGNSLGYFAGFIVATIYVNYLARIGYAKTIVKCFTAMIIGTLIILISGCIHLSFKYGIESAIINGFKPFIIGGIIKVIIGTLIITMVNRINWLKTGITYICGK